jgi:hypothetical protein
LRLLQCLKPLADTLIPVILPLSVSILDKPPSFRTNNVLLSLLKNKVGDDPSLAKILVSLFYRLPKGRILFKEAK